MKAFKAIAAMAENRVIGQGLRIPWHLPEDFKWFKSLTVGHLVVMGRRTYESIGRPLPRRTTVVLTRSGLPIPGVQTVADWRQIPGADSAREIFICGGAQVYQQTFPFCSEVFLTVVKRSVDGDVFLPPFEDLFHPPELLRDEAEFRILRYRSRALPGPADSPSLL